MRILITGSRNWRDRSAIALAISEWLESQGKSIGALPIPTIVHGGQRGQDDNGAWFGADWLAGEVARGWGFAEERHPADWSRGKKAGPERNQAMVDLGADVCIAFPMEGSRGTLDCMRRAEAAGIPVVNKGVS